MVVKIYGEELTAAAYFKYLGVTLEATGSIMKHLSVRTSSTQRAIGLLLSGIEHMPGSSHELSRYLWKALVEPVTSYGMELFAWSNADSKAICSAYNSGLRRLLHLGGRAPVDSAVMLAGMHCCTIEWRVRRVALLLRLLNSPPDSQQHLALAVLYLLKSPWTEAAIQDMQVVLPAVHLTVSTCPFGPLVTSTSRWSEAGDWLSAQPWQLESNRFGIHGCRCRTPVCFDQPPSEPRIVRQHIHNITRRLRTCLSRHSDTLLFERLAERGRVDQYGKTAALLMKAQLPGPPLHVVLDWTGPPAHRAAISALFAGDLFLGRYAGNYFAKSLLPTSATHLSQIVRRGLEPSRVCLFCWLNFRIAHLDDETHILLNCPAYASPRRDFIMEVAAQLSTYLLGNAQDGSKFKAVIASHCPQDWKALGRFIARLRQSRRQLRTTMTSKDKRYVQQAFHNQREAWRKSGKHVCRHGVFFNTCHRIECPCLAVPSEAGWTPAVLMPTISDEFKSIVIDTFDRHDFRRLGQLQAELKRRNWQPTNSSSFLQWSWSLYAAQMTSSLSSPRPLGRSTPTIGIEGPGCHQAPGDLFRLLRVDDLFLNFLVGRWLYLKAVPRTKRRLSLTEKVLNISLKQDLGPTILEDMTRYSHVRLFLQVQSSLLASLGHLHALI